MKNINEYLLTEPLNTKYKGERTDEVIGLLLASSLLAFACYPLFTEKGPIGGFFANLSSWFSKEKKKNDNDNDEGKKNKDEKNISWNDWLNNIDDNDGNDYSENYNKLLALTKTMNDKEKDETVKKENESMIKLLTACSFDKDGNEIPFDQRMEKMKDILPEDTDFEKFKKDMEDKYNKVKNDPKFKEQMAQAAKSIKDGDVEEFVKNAKSEAKETWAQIDKVKKEQAKIDDEIAELEAKVKNSSSEEKEKIKSQLEEKKSLKDKIKEKISTTTDTIATTLGLTKADNINGESSHKTQTSGKDDEPDPNKDLQDLKDQLKKEDKDRTKEWQQKLDDEKDPDKKKKLENDWVEEEKRKNKENKDLLKKAEQNKTNYEQAIKDAKNDEEKIAAAKNSYKEKQKEINQKLKTKEPEKPESVESDADESDLDSELSNDDKAEINKNTKKGSPKPEKPEFEVTKRPKERGEGNTYYKKGDPNKTALGPKDSPIVQNAIKAQVIYKKKLAAWQKNNPGVSEACEICNSKYMPLKVYMIKCSGILWD